MLMAHPEIDSVAEPWLLLPLVYMYRREGTWAKYSHAICQRALTDLAKNTAGGMATHREAIRQYVLTIYGNVSSRDATYFLDKTPRYYNIIEDIADIFPDAKFVFLFRNPLDVYASILNTWNEGSFKRIWAFKEDLEEGPARLSEGYRKLKAEALALRYEDLVGNPEQQLRRIMNYLGLNYDEDMLSMFAESESRGEMGDVTGDGIKGEVDVSRRDKWRQVFEDRFRQYVARKYIDSLPAHVLRTQGYDRQEILKQIAELQPTTRIQIRDVWYWLRAKAVSATKANLFLEKKNAWAKGRYVN